MDSYLISELPKESFPPLLHEIPDPPKQLYVRGTLPDWYECKILTVVGSRNYSAYGKEVTRSIIAGLKGYPVVIVSGLALGIDGIAHESALEYGLQTISVPGSGIYDAALHPRSHVRLARNILESGGALLSEFEPDMRATTWSFPQRNRIMAGMSHAVLIIEASEKSGTLITARLGMEYNRDVLTVPGSIFVKNSYGSHTLIRDGATPVTSSADILEALHLKADEEPAQLTLDVSTEELALLTLLESPLAKDDLIRAVAKPAYETNITITLLELKGYVRENDGVVMRVVSL